MVAPFRVVTYRGKTNFYREYDFAYYAAAEKRFEKYKENGNINKIELLRHAPDDEARRLNGFVPVKLWDRAEDAKLPVVVYNCFDRFIPADSFARRELEATYGLGYGGYKWVEVEWKLMDNGDEPCDPFEAAMMFLSQMDLNSCKPIIILPNNGVQAVELWKQTIGQTTQTIRFASYVTNNSGDAETLDVL